MFNLAVRVLIPIVLLYVLFRAIFWFKNNKKKEAAKNG